MLSKIPIISGGLLFGTLGAVAVNFGNPPNMGLCVAGFISDTAGALNLHHISAMQYIRPEIIGFTLGSMGAAVLFREWKPQGGASPLIRFLLGFFVMIGALVFLGCPVRMLLRLAGGDLNGIPALAGLLAGVFTGVHFLKQGFSLGDSVSIPSAAGFILPAIMMILFILAIAKPDFIAHSAGGPGAMHAPLFISLGFGLFIGFMAQRTRMCSIGAWRDLFLIGNTHLFSGIAALFVAALITNYLTGNFSSLYHWGFAEEPLAHSSHLWNFAGMGLVGLAATLIGGCPFRNLVLSGQGDLDAGSMVLGLFAGAVFANNFGLTSSPAGVTTWGPFAVVAGLVFCVIIGFIMRPRFP
ncbi:MAG: YedE family putative selenium transporter [Syntrophales bacterium]|nr:YedE family putative selenium transporter [Syntrophales bacterium]